MCTVRTELFYRRTRPHKRIFRGLRRRLQRRPWRVNFMLGPALFVTQPPSPLPYALWPYFPIYRRKHVEASFERSPQTPVITLGSTSLVCSHRHDIVWSTGAYIVPTYNLGARSPMWSCLGRGRRCFHNIM